jgi:hypothetical protein
MVQAGGQEAVKAAVEMVQNLTRDTMPEAIAVLPGTKSYRDAWEVAVKAAEKYNEPGVYTALHGYEWTSTEKGYNRHRVVIYRGGADQARMMEPYSTS